jgi:hypothetical protein
MSAVALKTIVWDHLRQRDLKGFARWLTPRAVTQAAHTAGVAFGRGPLHLANLVWQAKLRRVRPLGRDDQLVRYRPSHWPKAWAERGWPREMTVRLIRYQLRGFRPSGVFPRHESSSRRSGFPA